MPVRKVLNHRTAKPRAAGISAAGLLAVASSFAVLAGGCRAPPHAANHLDEAEGHEAGHGLEPPAEITTPPLVRMREFHGHLGPYVVLGYRMGEAARRALASPGYFDLRARVESPLAPPASCLIDGVQLGSGCTVGKRNLAVEEGKIARAVFDSRSGKRAAIALRPEVPKRIRERIAAVGVEAAGMEVFGAPDGDLFTIETGEAR
ncbi:MAG: formylmethanofuran dehydrogenase subunit E family protein [Planctomycetota bacterium]